MKLKPQMITHSMDNKEVMVSTDASIFSGIVTGNATSAFIMEQLKNDVTPDQIKQAMFEKYDAPYEVISKDVDDVIGKLRGIGVIDE